MTPEFTLLQKFAADGSQPAFAELARRYVDLVYSAAKRQLHNDAHAAEDVTQAVFLVLAQKAKSVPIDRSLSSWLLKVTAFCCANERRARARREFYERRAAEMAPTSDQLNGTSDWDELSPLLDQGLRKLAAADRDALLLRFMEQKSLRQVGEAMGISEEAAQKRVVRAVEKLRNYFHRRGMATLSVAGVTGLLAAKSVQAAPAALATSVSAIGATAAPVASIAALAKGTIVAMTMQKTGALAVLLLLLLLGVGGTVVAVHSWTASPHAHTITLKPEIPPADSRSSVTFSDGSNVRVVGMTEAANAPDGGIVNSLLGVIGVSASHPSTQPTKWWTADGAPAAPVSLAGLGTVSVGDMPGHRQLRFVFALAGHHFMDGSLDIRVPGTTGSGQSSNFIGGEERVNLVGSLPNKTSHTPINLYWATGPWHDDIVTPIASLLSDPPATTRSNTDIQYGAVSAEGKRTVVELLRNRFFNKDAAVRVLLFGKDGSQAYCSESQGFPNGKQIMKFNMPLEKADRLVWSSRPYEVRTLTDVALQPAAPPTTNLAQR